MISPKEISQLFRTAQNIDPTLSIKPRSLPRLSSLAIEAGKYNRNRLFKNMATGKISIFEDFPSPLRTARQRNLTNPTALILDTLYHSDIQDRIRTKSGEKAAWKYFTVSELAEKWQRKKANINVTDLHFRDTPIENVIDSKRLNQFNLYPGSTEHTSWLEMMTLVVSSRAGFSDSHSDDSDGSNHCFTGQKLWLAWDTHEGIANGLEDLDRQKIEGGCAFDVETYLSLQSACWFTIETGQTLFMPGHLTHKVLTLEPYLGVGGFYLAFPNLLRTLTRWLAHPPNWEKLERKGYRDLVYPDLITTAVKKRKTLRHATENSKLIWGLDYLKYAMNAWNRQTANAEKERLLELEDWGKRDNIAPDDIDLFRPAPL
ncbi:hypothetical protein [Candidatus Spongiihabitans sp.]|uniref:hypothetical protein n=1 Tax=Candidatus Spongiihabitans sp. TaxID=3101308 RepID=UPI003C7D3899